MTPGDLGLAKVFATARRRLRAAWMAATGEMVVPALGAAAVALVLIGWIWPWPWPEPAAAVVVAAGLVGLIGYGLFFRVPDFVVARALDRGLENHDELTTALEVDPDGAFSERLFDRVGELTTDDASEAIGLPFSWKPWAIGGALLVAALGLAVVQNPADDDRARLDAERAAIAEVAETLETRAEELADNPETEALAAEVAALAEELARESDLDDALARLEEVSTELAEANDAEALAERAASRGLQRTLEATPLAAGATPADQFEALAAAAAEGSLDEQQLAELAERLAELAATQEAGDPATADALDAAADAAAAGDLGALGAALGDAAGSSSDAAANAASGVASELTAADLERLADQLANAAAPGQESGEGSGSDEGDGSGSGEGEGPVSGEGEGEGSGPGSGEVSGGGGATASGNNPSGRGGGQNPDGTSSRDEASPEHAEATVVVPDGGESDILDADAQATGSGTSADPNRVDGLTTDGQASVPVRDVVSAYRDRAVDAVDSLSLAPSETEAVETYFDYLAGLTGGN